MYKNSGSEFAPPTPKEGRARVGAHACRPASAQVRRRVARRRTSAGARRRMVDGGKHEKKLNIGREKMLTCALRWYVMGSSGRMVRPA